MLFAPMIVRLLKTSCQTLFFTFVCHFEFSGGLPRYTGSQTPIPHSPCPVSLFSVPLSRLPVLVAFHYSGTWQTCNHLLFSYNIECAIADNTRFCFFNDANTMPLNNTVTYLFWCEIDVLNFFCWLSNSRGKLYLVHLFQTRTANEITTVLSWSRKLYFV